MSNALDYEKIFHEMAVGFAIHEMLFDPEGRPADYRFLDANPAYEAITGLRIDEVRGKRVREVLPSIEERWIETYGRVVLTGAPIRFTDYAEALGMYFDVWAYRPDAGRFVVMVEDVTKRTVEQKEALRQAAVIRAVLGSIDSAVAFKGLDGLYLGCNRVYERVFGTTESRIVGKSDADIHEGAKAARIQAEDREILATGVAIAPDRVWQKDALGRERLFERSKLPLVAEGRPFGIAVFWHDIGDAVLAEKADEIHVALAREAVACSALELLARAVDELEAATGSELGFFASVEDASGRMGPRAERAGEGRPIAIEGGSPSDGAFDLLPGHAPLLRTLVLPIIRDGEAVGMLGLANKGSPYNDWDIALSAKVANSAWEICERKKAQEKVAGIALQRDLAISAMRAGVETWYLDEGRKEYDERWAAILGYTLAELPADSMDAARLLSHPADYEASAESLRAYLNGESEGYESEIRMRHKDGHWVWVLDRARIVERGPRGEPLRLSGLIIDISGIKAAQEKLEAIVGEKNVLLQELFHRTKNTMQLINAMLELKKQGLESSPFDQAIEAVQGKIIAMSLVQEKLYRGGDLSVLDLGEYVSELVDLIRDGTPIVPANVSISSSTVPVPVSIDAAIPCGLIVSELVSNAIVHAFPDGMRGRIEVSVALEDEEISIDVRDDGVGLPAGYDLRAGSRLGLRTIVGIGEEQLHGRMEFGSGLRGFSCRLTFKDVYYPRRL